MEKKIEIIKQNQKTVKIVVVYIVGCLIGLTLLLVAINFA